jgi:hypothetical protein
VSLLAILLIMGAPDPRVARPLEGNERGPIHA